MTSTNTRVDKSFKNLDSFSKEILVCCPHCKKQARVITEFSRPSVHPSSERRTSKFYCGNCYKSLDEGWWYGKIIISPVNAKCGNCGSTLEKEKRVVNKHQTKMKVKCNQCGQSRLYPTRIELTYANSGQATDPYLGLPLWLQIPLDGNVLWAYNFEHLSYLKDYVGAKLREPVNGGKYSLIWRLPNFIKLAKNRDKVLKAIGRLESK